MKFTLSRSAWILRTHHSSLLTTAIQQRKCKSTVIRLAVGRRALYRPPEKIENKNNEPFGYVSKSCFLAQFLPEVVRGLLLFVYASLRSVAPEMLEMILNEQSHISLRIFLLLYLFSFNSCFSCSAHYAV